MRVSIHLRPYVQYDITRADFRETRARSTTSVKNFTKIRYTAALRVLGNRQTGKRTEVVST